MAQKPRSIQKIEERMGVLDPSSFRYRVLGAARDFKSSWIELGQHLFTVYRDKLYRDWSYLTFEAYCAKEIGIRQSTAVKLLKSYAFLEKEEPHFLKRETLEGTTPTRIPGFEAVNALRLAKANDRVSENDYEGLREDVFESAAEDADVKKKLRYILKTGKNGPSEQETKETVLKKLTAYLETTRNDATSLALPAKILKKLDELLELLKDYQK
jgi:hypothetical protein